jgi:phosphate transport system permease protein
MSPADEPRVLAPRPSAGSSASSEDGARVLAPKPTAGASDSVVELTELDRQPVHPTEVAAPQAPSRAGLGGVHQRHRVGDRVFAALAAGAGIFTIILIGLIGLFLLAKAWPSIRDNQVNFLLSRDWTVTGEQLRFGVVDLLYTTVISSLVAMAVAVPVAVGIALFITQYAPRALARPVGYLVDLLAAIPSIIFGIWGIYVLAPHLTGVQHFLYHFSFVPLFADKGFDTGTVFNAAVVLAIMILPIVTAVSRDVFERTPTERVEAAWALGATRWEMIRLAVLPHGRAGVVSGAMLGLGRALGETIAVTLILSTVGQGNAFSWSIFNGGATFASKIANAAAEFNNPKQTGAYIAAGLVLFVLTFVVNAIARTIVSRDNLK